MMTNKTGKNGKKSEHIMKFVEPSVTADGMTRQYCLVCRRVTPHKNGVCVWR